MAESEPGEQSHYHSDVLTSRGPLLGILYHSDVETQRLNVFGFFLVLGSGKFK